MEIIEGNKLIAEFMGWYINPEINKGSDINWFHNERSTRITKDVLLPTKPESFKYHTSWDLLMPVVEKIIEIDIHPVPNWAGYRVEIVPSGYVKIEGGSMAPIFKNVSIVGGLIKAVWLAIVDFIKWYNEQN